MKRIARVPRFSFKKLNPLRKTFFLIYGRLGLILCALPTCIVCPFLLKKKRNMDGGWMFKYKTIWQMFRDSVDCCGFIENLYSFLQSRLIHPISMNELYSVQPNITETGPHFWLHTGEILKILRSVPSKSRSLMAVINYHKYCVSLFSINIWIANVINSLAHYWITVIIS